MTFSHPAFKGLIGVARADITPPVGIYARNWGAATHETAEGIHRPLTLAVLTLQGTEGEPPLVLAAADLGWWRSRDDEEFVRSGVLEALALDPSRFIFSLSHTHAGPSLCREDAGKPGGDLVPPYVERLRATIIETAQAALSNRQPALLEWTYGTCSLAQPRDLTEPGNPARTVCGFDPSATPDTTLLVGRVTSDEGRTLATLVNYACHPTTLAFENRLISPDYVGALREVVEAETDAAPCLFLQGASGELAPRRQYVGDPEVTDRHGRAIGHAAVSALQTMEKPGQGLQYNGVVESGAPLAMWTPVAANTTSVLRAREIRVELPLKPMPAVKEIEDELAATADVFMAERLRRKRLVRRNVGDGTTMPMSVWVWQVGGAIFAAVPAEAYSQLQVQLRESSPDSAVCVMNVANGWFGYLPPAGLYDRDLYAVWQTPFDRGSLERMIDGCDAAIAQVICTPAEEQNP